LTIFFHGIIKIQLKKFHITGRIFYKKSFAKTRGGAKNMAKKKAKKKATKKVAKKKATKKKKK
jgi:hypothetical protein